MTFRTLVAGLLATSAALGFSGPASSQAPIRITPPAEFLGHEVSADYMLADYTKLVAYWRQLAKRSDRIKMVDIGPSSAGRRQYMLVISSPENLAKLDHYRAIATKLGRPYGVGPDEAKSLAKEGRAFVWIDGCLHTKETVPCQSLFEQSYQMATLNDDETRKFLNENILLLANANPDGMEEIARGYMAEPDPRKRAVEMRIAEPFMTPRNAGHDNNRDFFFSALPETTNMNRVLYKDWLPELYYNPHQTGPQGGTIFIPPFREPPDYYTHPLMMSRIGELGASISGRLLSEGKAGTYSRGMSSYTQWVNGGSNTSGYMHNMLGIMTEVAGQPHPIQIPLVPDKQIGQLDLPRPVEPRIWHAREALEYQISAHRAVMAYAANNRERLLWETYVMRADSIKLGNTDDWTVRPHQIAALKKAAEGQPEPDYGAYGRSGGLTTGNLRGWAQVDAKLFTPYLRNPENRNPRGYIIPSDQVDFANATEFANALIKSGVTVERSTAPFTVAGKSYPVGSLVVRTAQPYRPHILDMFEPQDHPDDLVYPGGPPRPPFDAAGWTLAYQMGVKFDRVLDGFDGPFEKHDEVLKLPAGKLEGEGAAGFVVDHAINNGFLLSSRLLKAGAPLFWQKGGTRVGGKILAPGALWIPASARANAIVEQAVDEFGIDAMRVPAAPEGDKIGVKMPRIAIFDRYGGLMPAGWTRWLLDKFEVPYTTVYASELDRGGWQSKYDVVVFSDQSVNTENRRYKPIDRAEVLPKYRHMVGDVSEKTAAQLKAFTDRGGDVIAVGTGGNVAKLMGLPVGNYMTEVVDGKEKPLPSSKYYVAPSVLAMTVDPAQPVAFGASPQVDILHNVSPTYRVAKGPGIDLVGWYQGDNVLRSGWAIGQKRMNGGAAIVDVKSGKGTVKLIGPEVTFRGQPSGSYRFLLNALMLSTADNVK